MRQLALTLIVALLVAAQTAWAQVDLSTLSYDDESKTYSISSEEDLKTLSAYVEAGNNCEGLTFQVTTSIQFTTEPFPGESNFTAIGSSDHPFCGTFDGGNNNGYSIKGIVINASTYYQGLFGYVGEYEKNATIRNVTIENSEINSTASYVGGIVGYNEYGTIENCTSSATISSTGSNCENYGGIAGKNSGTIEYCTSHATVSSEGGYCQKYGGIAGENSGSIEYCTSSAVVSEKKEVNNDSNYGGIAGSNNRGTIANCTSHAKVSALHNCGGIAGESMGGTLSNNFAINAEIKSTNVDKIGAIVGFNYNYKAILTNNYYYKCDANGETEQIGAQSDDWTDNNGAVPAKNPVKLTLPECFEVTDGVLFGIDYVEKGSTIQFAPKLGYTKPTSVSILRGESLTPNTYGFYTVKVDKDMTIVAESTPTEQYEISTVADLIIFSISVNKGNNFEGKTITVTANIKLPAPEEEGKSNFTAIGTSGHPFCGTFDGGGFTISGIRISASTNDQGLFGCIDDATVQNVTIDETMISSTGSECSYYGGIVGYNYCGTIENCTSSATVSATGEYCRYYGGIVGLNAEGTIANCTSSAKVSATGEYCNYYGGIAGYQDGTLSNNIAINAEISATEDIGAIAGGQDYNTLTNNYYYNCTINGEKSPTGVGFGSNDVNEAEYPDGAVPADFLIDGDSEESVVVSETIDDQIVIFRRSFKTGITATVILPFGFDADTYFKDKGTFHTLDEVSYNNETSQWEATPSEAIDAIEANHPYIFKPLADFDFVVFKGVKVEQNTGISKASSEIEISVETKAEKWNLVGVYTNKTWSVRTPNEYGFAAKQISYTDNETQEEVNITAGEFVRAGANAKMKPTRAYLRYTGDNVVLNPGIQSKSAAELPDRIVLIFPDETASVIDNPSDDPSDSGDVTTPTSELVNPAVSAKVWAYDKTIFIAAAPNTAYRIIDANGRLLKESTTQTDRDEIRLGSRSGIVIVIIGGRAYKVNY